MPGRFFLSSFCLGIAVAVGMSSLFVIRTAHAQPPLTGTKVTSPGAQSFRNELFDKLLGSNFRVEPLSFRTSADLAEVVEKPQVLRKFLRERLDGFCKEGAEPGKCDKVLKSLGNAYLEVTRSTPAAYTWALWLYKIDEDNWFTFERLAGVTKSYFSGDRVLIVVKGFDPSAFFVTGGVSTIDLPVVIDLQEKTVTLWTAELFD